MQEQESEFIYERYESSQKFLQQTFSSQKASQKQIQPTDPSPIQLNIFSSYKEVYQNYFLDVEKEVEVIIKNRLKDNQARIQHKLVLLNENQMMHDLISFKKPTNYIIGNLYGGVVVKYQVVIGNYKLSLDLLNLNLKAPNDLIKIGSGGYGMIFKVSVDGQTTFAAKRIQFHEKFKLRIDENEFIKPNKLEINEAISEYSIYKICSFYKIGPKIITTGFDLVCFENCIQFYIEYCNRILLLYPSLEHQLKIAVRLLHKLKIIHKDIKPSNLLYSHANDKLVLCDFGISHPVEQEQGQLTKTYKQGSPRFMSQQMVNIKIGQESCIDLYYNDLHGLEVSLCQLNQACEKSQKKIIFKQKNMQKCHINILYTAINIFYDLINNDISSLITLIDKSHDMINDINDFFKQILNQQIKNMIELNQQIKIRFNTVLSMSKKSKKSEQMRKIFYLIRCYGLSELLYDQLSLLPKSDFITKIVNKINIHPNASNDLTPWYHLQKLKKTTALKLKIQRKIKNLQEYTNGIKSDLLLDLYFQLFYIKLRKQQYIDKQCIQLKNKILKAYKVRAFDERYKQLNIVLDILDNKNIKIYEKKILQFIVNYPQLQQTILKKVIQFCRKQYAAPYYLKLLQFYKKKKQSDHLKICELLQFIVQHYSHIKQSQMVQFYLHQLVQTVQLIKNKNGKHPSIKVYMWLGNIEALKNNYHNAIKYYKECQEKQKIYSGQISLNRATMLFNIGQKYFRLQQYENAVAYMKQSVQIYKLYSYQIQQEYKLSTCYSYLCIIYYINKNHDLFKKYLDLYTYESMIHLRKWQSNDPATEFKQVMKESVNEIIASQINKTKVIDQKYNNYCNVFNFGFRISKRMLNIIKFIKDKDQSIPSEYLLQLFEDNKEFEDNMHQLFEFIVTDRFIHKEVQISYLNQYLNYEQISKIIPLKDKTLQKLYGEISQQYLRIQQKQLCYAYLKKYFRVMQLSDILDYKYYTTNLMQLSFIMKRYHQCIYFAKRILNKIDASLYIFIPTSYFHLHQYKAAIKYQIQYLKHYFPWQIKSYQLLMKLYFQTNSKNNFMIIRCYLCELLSDKINIASYTAITKEDMIYDYHICKIVIEDGQTKNQQQCLKALKISKRCLWIKLKIGCLKYMKSKHLKKSIKNKIKQLN